MEANNAESCLAYIEQLRRSGMDCASVREALRNSDYSVIAINVAIKKARKLMMWTVYPTCMGIPADKTPMWIEL